MPDVTIVKLKIRRGTDIQRRAITLEQGELGYATDTRRVFVGDGITVGGVPVSNINHPPIADPANLITQQGAGVNDFIYAGSFLYQLTASDYTSLDSWVRVSNNLLADEKSIGYTSIGGKEYLKINDGGITGSMFSSSATQRFGGLSATPTGLKVNVDTSTLTITNNNLLSIHTVDQRHISNTSFVNGITGGSGEPIRLNVDQSYFEFTEGDDQLTITNIPDNSVSFAKLDPSIVGSGLIVANNQILSQYVRGLGPGLQEDGYGNLLISDTTTRGNTFFKSVEYNSRGQILSAAYTISTVLSCDSSIPELAIFNGCPNPNVVNNSFSNQTIITVISANPYNTLETEQLTLSSAGFICFESTKAKDNAPVSRFAIPVYAY